MSKICKKCTKEKEIDAFSNYSASKDGKRPWCRECMNAHNKAYMKTPRGKEIHKGTNKRYYANEKGKEYRKKDYKKWKEYRREQNKIKRKAFRKTEEGKEYTRLEKRKLYDAYPEKTLARSKVYYAIKTGKLIKPDNCQECGKESKLEGHHHDYSKPLDVKWLCNDCHNLIHNPRRD